MIDCVNERTADETELCFLVRLGATMAGANYPITMVQRTLLRMSEGYGVTHEILVLPNYVQVGGTNSSGNTALHVAHPDRDISLHQSFPLARLVAAAQSGSISPEDGMAELDRIQNLPMRFPRWVSIVGYAIQSLGLALILQPAPWALGAALGLGLLVGLMSALADRSDALAQLLPIIGAFVVSLAAFAVTDLFHLGEGSLRVLIAPLAYFLPGAGITLAVIELSTGQMISGSSRLISGLMRIAQLAFGILIAAQVAGIGGSNLTDTPNNQLGAWAPWLGVLVYAIGIMLNFGPPTAFMPWMLLILVLSYSGQVLGSALLGSYASGFCGAVTLTVCAVAISRLPNSPPTVSLILPGFWLLVPGSLGLIGVTELVGTHSSTVLTATLISMISIALGIQSGVLAWQAVSQLRGVPDRPAFRG